MLSNAVSDMSMLLSHATNVGGRTTIYHGEHCMLCSLSALKTPLKVPLENAHPIGDDFNASGQPDARDFAQRGVRLLRCCGEDARAHAPTLRRPLQCRAASSSKLSHRSMIEQWCAAEH